MSIKHLFQSLFIAMSILLLFSCNKKEEFEDDPDLEPVLITGTQNTARILENIFSNPSRVDYIITGNWDITAPVIIEPGVRIAIESRRRIRVSGSGSLAAVGTTNAPIIFEGATASAGFWEYLSFESNNPDNRLEYCMVRHGGGSSLSSYPGMVVVRNNAQVAIVDCEVKDSQRNGILVGDNDSRFSEFARNDVSSCELFPISLRSSHVGALDFETIFTQNNGFNRIEVNGNNVNTSINIPKVNGPYLFKGNTNFNAATNIAPGTLIEMGPSARFTIGESGSLSAIGTENERITIRGEQRAKGYWDYIYFNRSRSPNNQFNYVDIAEGGGSSLSCCGANVSASDAIFSMGNSSVTDSQRWGMVIRSGSEWEDLGGNIFSGNELGDID
jgi:hypothetical protein